MTTSSPASVVTPRADVPGEDQAAVAALPGRIMAAWAQHDAKAFAGIFTEEGSMILPGVHRTGRQEIETFMSGAFQGPYRGTRVTGTPLGLTFLSPEVAVVITRGGVLAPGESTVADERAVRATWVAVKRDREWFLAAYQNSPRDSV
ncbi:SgcJ/EcaC family oxidoreductase [Streptomyces alkaliphilus]|uniref:SgcJ/EcaC family oxidoreductase n=1 Tax=Streptomyces alkaliphilus TaxID=1472722 RepID=A0A7W3XZU9_9ACTN|nr:SgcJ/EcaC family oxidoreductase [Streptomyces alkaliphilus]MBB0242667.1 SgcJ/EcaC family oxidoreductase [Streptomyces alkaliphilus]